MERWAPTQISISSVCAERYCALLQLGSHHCFIVVCRVSSKYFFDASLDGLQSLLGCVYVDCRLACNATQLTVFFRTIRIMSLAYERRNALRLDGGTDQQPVLAER
jgi:hypothetical protein